MVGRISRRNIRFIGALALALTMGVVTLQAATPAQAATAARLCPTYVVQPGDWLSKIAARYSVSWQYLAQINHLANPNLIYVGQRLAICGAAVKSTPPPTTTTGTKPPPAGTTPPPSGSAAGTDWAAEICHSNVYYTGSIYMWKVPPGVMPGCTGSIPRITSTGLALDGVTGGRKCCILPVRTSCGTHATARPSPARSPSLLRVSRARVPAAIMAKSSPSFRATGS